MQITKRLYEMKTKELKEVEVKIAEATEEINRLASYGDISENSEYDTAVNEREMLINQQKEISLIIETAEIIEPEDTSRIVIGSILKIINLDEGFEKIVLFDGIEDYHKGIISPESNLGKKIYNRDASTSFKIDVETPVGSIANFQVEKLRNCGEYELYSKNNPGLQATLHELLKDIGKVKEESNSNEEVDPNELGKALQGYSNEE